MKYQITYDDGSVKEFTNGILFTESEDGHLECYTGTGNKLNMYIAIYESMAAVLQETILEVQDGKDGEAST